MGNTFNLTEVVVLKATHGEETKMEAFILNSATKRQEFITRVLEIYRKNVHSVLFRYPERKRGDVQVQEGLNEFEHLVITASVYGFEDPFKLEIFVMTGWDGEEAEDHLILMQPLKLTMDKMLKVQDMKNDGQAGEINKD